MGAALRSILSRRLKEAGVRQLFGVPGEILIYPLERRGTDRKCIIILGSILKKICE
jgi:hypothetical protein